MLPRVLSRGAGVACACALTFDVRRTGVPPDIVGGYNPPLHFGAELGTFVHPDCSLASGLQLSKVRLHLEKTWLTIPLSLPSPG